MIDPYTNTCRLNLFEARIKESGRENTTEEKKNKTRNKTKHGILFSSTVPAGKK